MTVNMPETVEFRKFSVEKARECLASNWGPRRDSGGWRFNTTIGGIRWEFVVLPQERAVGLYSITTRMRLGAIQKVEYIPEELRMKFLNSKDGYYEVSEGGLLHSLRSLPQDKPKEIKLGEINV